MGFYSGIAGARGKAPFGVVPHNDAGSQLANAKYYRKWLPSHNAANGFAHYYVADDDTFRAEAEKNKAWHTANSNGNANYIGVEICQSMGDEATFRANEKKANKLMAEILTRYDLKPNRRTVILHKQFSPTACPHRSVSLHGDGTVMQDYFIKEISKYMNGQTEEAGTIIEEKPKGEVTMQLLFNVEGDGATYYFDGKNVRALTHPDQIKILDDIYQANNGKQIPRMSFKNDYPLQARLIQVANLPNEIEKK